MTTTTTTTTAAAAAAAAAKFLLLDALPDPPELLALEPNEVHITLWRARNLKIMDTKLFSKVPPSS